MEGIKTYEDSKMEITRILKSMGSRNFSVDTDKLDERTKSELLLAMRDVLTKRSRQIDSVILGVHWYVSEYYKKWNC